MLDRPGAAVKEILLAQEVPDHGCQCTCKQGAVREVFSMDLPPASPRPKRLALKAHRALSRVVASRATHS